MALNPGEVRSGGNVHDAEGRRVLYVMAGGAPLDPGQVKSGGRVVDADGREVVVNAAGGGLPTGVTWTAVTPAAGWTDGQDTVGVWPEIASARVGPFVYFRGHLQNTSGGASPGDSPLFTLAVADRPTQQRRTVTHRSDLTTPLRLNFLTTGVVTLVDSIANLGYVSLDNLVLVLP